MVISTHIVTVRAVPRLCHADRQPSVVIFLGSVIKLAIHIGRKQHKVFMVCGRKIGVHIRRDDANVKGMLKNERRFPNGTVLGTYTYKDKYGNPVHVKYYADDSSYGVELKSAIIFEADSEYTSKQKDELSKVNATIASSNVFGPVDAISTADIMSKDYYKNNSYNPYEVLNSYPNKNNKGNPKSDDNYEIFTENDLKFSDKNNKEKVRVYVDKNKRKIRNVPNHYKLSKNFYRF